MGVQSILLDSFSGKNTRTPVWFMRQAGRFLPEYRAIRKNHSLDEMFRDPETVARVTCLPVDILKVDAAILFADILTLPMHLGFAINFDPEHGPVIKNPYSSSSNLRELHNMDDVAHIRKAIALINSALPADVPLIGFAGSPFTVLCYLVEGGSTTNFRRVFAFMNRDPEDFQRLMDFLTVNTIAYLKLQKQAGIKVFQLFDTWGGLLRAEDYQTAVLPYIKAIFREVDLPSIYYLKNCSHLLRHMEKSGSDFLSVCETVDLATDPVLASTKHGVQGNLFQGLLYNRDEILKKEVLNILKASRKFKKYIFNLSHGIQPDVPVEKVKLVLDLVHCFKR